MTVLGPPASMGRLESVLSVRLLMRRGTLLAVLLVMLATPAVLAHHSVAGQFDMAEASALAIA